MLMLLSVQVARVLFLVLARKFCPDYGLLLALHALTLVARSYALLSIIIECSVANVGLGCGQDQLVYLRKRRCVVWEKK